MARYDKYDPISGGFRAKLAADLTLSGGAIGPVAVSLDATGKVVVGTAGQSGPVGVLVKNVARGPVGQYGTPPGSPVGAGGFMGALAGDVVDIMTAGEIVEVTGLTPGRKVYAAANGTLNTTGGTGSTLVGWTVEAGRLVVRMGANPTVLP